MRGSMMVTTVFVLYTAAVAAMTTTITVAGSQTPPLAQAPTAAATAAPAESCTPLVCGEFVSGPCFRWHLERRRCLPCDENFFGIELAKPTTVVVDMILEPKRKYEDSLYFTDAISGQVIEKISDGLRSSSQLQLALPQRVKLHIESAHQADGLQCIPSAVFKHEAKHLRGYSLTMTIGPARCPPLDLDLGCGQRVQVEGKSSRDAVLLPPCGCDGQRSTVGGRLVCLEDGSWSGGDLSEPLCRSAPHPARVVVILDVRNNPARTKHAAHATLTHIVSHFKTDTTSSSNGDRVAVVYYSGRSALVRDLGDQRPIPEAGRGGRRPVLAFQLARQKLTSWKEEDVNLTGPSPTYSVLLLSHLKPTATKEVVMTDRLRNIAKLIKQHVGAGVHMLEFGVSPANKNPLRDIPSLPHSWHRQLLKRGTSRGEKLKAVSETLNRLTPSCIQLQCNQIRRGECAFISARPKRCWTRERCQGFGFEQTSNHPLVTQLHTQELVNDGDEFIVNRGFGKENVRVFRCKGTDCHGRLSAYSATDLALRSPTFVPGLHTGWSGPQVWVEIRPDTKRPGCIPGPVDVAILPALCPDLKPWPVGEGTLSLPDTPELGSRFSVSCTEGHLVRRGTAVYRCENAKFPARTRPESTFPMDALPPSWHLPLRPVCESIRPNEKTCPRPTLPSFINLAIDSGSARFLVGEYPLKCDPGYVLICDGDICTGQQRTVECSRNGTWIMTNWDTVFCRKNDPGRLAGYIRRRFDLMNAVATDKPVCSIDMSTTEKSWMAEAGTASQPTPDSLTEEAPTRTSLANGTAATAGSNTTASTTATTGKPEEFNTCSIQKRVIQKVDVCLELAFILDTSGSMNEDDLASALNFTRRLISFFAFRISDDFRVGARVALMTFREITEVQLSLEEGTSSRAVFNTLREIGDQRNDSKGDTNLRKALKTFRSEVAPAARERCPQRLLFVLTDGNVNTGGGVTKLRAVARDIIDNYGWEIYAIGIKNTVFGKTILEEIVSKEVVEHLFILTNREFKAVVDNITRVDVDYTQCGQDNFLDEFSTKSLHHRGPVRTANYPWMAMIYRTDANEKFKHQCGGTLVRYSKVKGRKIFVITAAHCIVGTGFQVDSYRVRLGETIVSVNEGVEEDFQIKSVKYRKTLYRPLENQRLGRNPFDNDIAIIELKRQPKLGPAIRTICLPETDDKEWNTELGPKAKVVVGGWGPKRVGNKLSLNSDHLKAINLYVVNQTQCMRVMDATQHMLCAHNPTDNVDACPGDSGGPLMRRRIDSAGKSTWFIAGIVSYGPDGSQGSCSVFGQYGVYTRLNGAILKWVDEKLQTT